MFQTKNNLIIEAMAVLKPPPRQTVSQWADEFRRLSPEASATPGRWRTRIVEFMREPMDCLTDGRIRRTVIMAGSQVAKSESLLNAIGYFVHNDPGPILVMQPTLEMAQAFSKDRIAPMVRDTPVLRELVSDGKSRDSGNTILHKVFPGGHLTMVGANSPSALASRPIRVVLQDEVDRFPASAGAEGDPVNLAIKRTVTFWNRCIGMASTPTVKGESRIEAAYLEGDQRRWWCPCPDCGEHQPLVWAQVHWTPGQPETAGYTCEHCGSIWNDSQRIAAVRAGEWRASAPFTGVASFHVPGLLSPFSPLADGVREFLEAKGNPERLKTWVNTFLGETWEDDGDRVDANDLIDRCEEWGDGLPEGVTVLTAGVDVQDDRLEIEVVGWGDDFTSWSVEHRTFYGDPTAGAVWNELARFLKQSFLHPHFGELNIRATCLDTGYHTQQCYAFARVTPRLYPVKGIGGDGKPVVGKPSKNNTAKIPVFPVGTMDAKDLVVARLKAKPGETGYCAFPLGRDIEYFRQLTAEKLVTKFHKGFKKREWIKTRTRNEAFDLRVYATVALELLSVDLKAQRRAMVRDWMQRNVPTTDPTPKRQRVGSQSSSYATRWKNYD